LITGGLTHKHRGRHRVRNLTVGPHNAVFDGVRVASREQNKGRRRNAIAGNDQRLIYDRHDDARPGRKDHSRPIAKALDLIRRGGNGRQGRRNIPSRRAYGYLDRAEIPERDLIENSLGHCDKSPRGDVGGTIRAMARKKAAPLARRDDPIKIMVRVDDLRAILAEMEAAAAGELASAAIERIEEDIVLALKAAAIHYRSEGFEEPEESG